MTVCIATNFRWRNGLNDLGTAVLTASDRQLTAGDIEYEPPQQKICFVTPRVMILISGSFPIHSEALLYTQRSLAENPQSDPGVIAEIYASYIRDIKSRFASQTYLSPFGLNGEEFLNRQRDLAPEFVSRIAAQLQNYQHDDTEALIVGSDDRSAYTYLMDQNSHVTLHNDVGFAAIGVGAWHAKSQLMRVSYGNNSDYATALALIYAAKRAAEVAPGVGRETDLYITTKFGSEPVLPSTKDKMAEIFAEYEKKRNDATVEAIIALRKHIIEFNQSIRTNNPQSATEQAPQSPPSTTDDPSPPPPLPE